MVKLINYRKLEHLHIIVEEAGRVAMPVEALTEKELSRLMDASPIPEESKALDHLGAELHLVEGKVFAATVHAVQGRQVVEQLKLDVGRQRGFPSDLFKVCPFLGATTRATMTALWGSARKALCPSAGCCLESDRKDP